jgi:hypothetical protein
MPRNDLEKSRYSRIASGRVLNRRSIMATVVFPNRGRTTRLILITRDKGLMRKPIANLNCSSEGVRERLQTKRHACYTRPGKHFPHHGKNEGVHGAQFESIGLREWVVKVSVIVDGDDQQKRASASWRTLPCTGPRGLLTQGRAVNACAVARKRYGRCRSLGYVTNQTRLI